MPASSRGAQVVDGTDGRSLRTAAQRLSRVGELFHHPWMEQDLSAAKTSIDPDGHEGNVIPLANGSLFIAIALEVASASRAVGGSLCVHRFTRFLKSGVQRAGSGRYAVTRKA